MPFRHRAPKRSRLSTFALTALTLLAVQCVHKPPPVPSASVAPGPPRRLLLLIFDEMTAGAVETQDLPHFKALAARALSFKNAYVGHLAATDMVSFPVLATGLFPKHLAWQDEILQDSAGKLGPRGHYYLTSALRPAQFKKWMVRFQEGSLLSRLMKGQRGPAFVVTRRESLGRAMLLPSAATLIAPAKNPSPVPQSWVSDSVLGLMRDQPQWRAIVAIWPGIGADKQGDTELGKILADVSQRGLEPETLIVVMGAHGKQTDQSYFGSPGARTASDLAFGKLDNVAHAATAPASLAPALASPLVDTLYADTALRFWLKQKDRVSIAKFSNLVRSLPGVAEVYTKQDTGNAFHYILTYRSPKLVGSALEWSDSRTQDLLETMVGKSSPEVVALLLEATGYGAPEDFGGAQEAVQRVPLFFLSPHLRDPGSVSSSRVGLADVTPMILRLMGLPVPDGLDGSASPIEEWVEK